MSPTAATSPRKMGTLRRWNSILLSDHRRSQSLTSMDKSSSIEALRSTTSLGLFRPRDDEQSSILTVSSTTEAIVEENDGNLDRSAPTSPSRSTHSRQSSFNTSPPLRPKPAPRLWNNTPSSTASLKGLETSIAPNHVLPAVQSPLQTITLATSSSPVPESPKSAISKFSTWKEKSFAGRRKGSVPDLELNSDKIGKAFNPNSPSLPPIHSARTESTIMTLGSITPRPLVNDQGLSASPINYAALRTPEWQDKDQRRASSMLLPSGLAPIVIPSAPARIPPVPPIDTTMMNKRKDEDRPPRPPPKSPRTLLRAFPIPKSAAIPGRHTANSSITSISPIETPSTAASTWSPVSAYSASTVNTPDAFTRSPAKHNAITFEESSKTIPIIQPLKYMPNLKHGRSVSNTNAEPRLPRKSSSPALGNHSRIVSDTSVINRGRPMKRSEPIIVHRAPVLKSKIGLVNGQFPELPQGIRKSQAGQISVDEFHGLRRDAEDRASNYNILTQQQIVGLDQEQRYLDNTCRQMQHTISGLKEARKATYLNLKLFLEAPGTTNSTREHILKQTKSLHDLDVQIDDWQTKLNTATERKLAIQSRVWEHLTAVLAAANLAADVGRPEEQTPPRSPERIIRQSYMANPIQEDGIMNDFETNSRNEVESITVFADSGVAHLLRSIEEELDVIDQSRSHYAEDIMV